MINFFGGPPVLDFSCLYQGNTLSLTIAIVSLVDFLAALKMTSRPSVLAWQSDKKTDLY